MRYLRQTILVISAVCAVGLFGLSRQVFLSQDLQTIRLVQWYGLVAVGLLYLSLLPGPLYRVFPSLPGRAGFMKARRAFGVASFFYALLHSSVAFFGLLGGFAGFLFLVKAYQSSVIFGMTALIIMAAMAATSFDKLVQRMHRWWKRLHRLIYVAGTLIVIHTVQLGSNYIYLTSLVAQISFALLALLLILEAICVDRLLHRTFPLFITINISLAAVTAFLTGLWFYIYFPRGTNVASLGVHAQHIQIAKEAQSARLNPSLPTNIPGLNGDRTKRYTVSFAAPPNVSPNQDVQLHFRVYDAASGNLIQLFTPVYTKLMHVVVVDSELTYFSHIHPDFQGSDFVVATRFPKDDVYHLYVDFQPAGGIEQQFGFTLPVGAGASASYPTVPVDYQTTKQFDQYEVRLSAKAPLVASQLSIGQVPLAFTLFDVKTKSPITTLKPYLGAFGHLVMINEQTYEYIHVHPNTLTQPQPDQNGGPTVEFLPLGLYGPIKPGIYRVFAQFNPDNNLFVADFTVAIQ